MRVNIRVILADPLRRRDLIVSACLTLQARENIETTRSQMEEAYDKVQAEKIHRSI